MILVSAMAAMVLFAAATVPAVTTAQQQGPIEISSCATITQPGHYVLAQDIRETTNEQCLTIQASDVVIDGQNHLVDGDSPESGTGILVENQQNVTVRNVRVQDWQYGTYVSQSAGVTLQQVRSFQSQNGLYVYYSSPVEISQSAATAGGTGIAVYGSENVALIANDVLNNEEYGIYTQQSSVVGERNTITGGAVGLYLYQSDDSVFNSTRVTNTTQYGMTVQYSENVTLYRTYVSGNEMDLYPYESTVTAHNFWFASSGWVSFQTRNTALTTTRVGLQPPNGSLIGGYLNASATGTPAWMNLTVVYAAADFPENSNPESAQWWKHTGSGWEQVLANQQVATSNETVTLTANISVVETTPVTFATLVEVQANETVGDGTQSAQSSSGRAPVAAEVASRGS